MPLPLLPLAIAGASGLVGALSNRGRTSKSSQTTTQSTTPEADGLNSVLMNLIRSRLQGSTASEGRKIIASATAGIHAGREIAPVTSGRRRVRSIAASSDCSRY